MLCFDSLSKILSARAGMRFRLAADSQPIILAIIDYLCSYPFFSKHRMDVLSDPGRDIKHAGPFIYTDDGHEVVRCTIVSRPTSKLSLGSIAGSAMSSSVLCTPI